MDLVLTLALVPDPCAATTADASRFGRRSLSRRSHLGEERQHRGAVPVVQPASEPPDDGQHPLMLSSEGVQRNVCDTRAGAYVNPVGTIEDARHPDLAHAI